MKYIKIISYTTNKINRIILFILDVSFLVKLKKVKLSNLYKVL